jgi:hypothetical protein
VLVRFRPGAPHNLPLTSQIVRKYLKSQHNLKIIRPKTSVNVRFRALEANRFVGHIRYIIQDCNASLALVSDTLADRILPFADQLQRNCPVMVIGQNDGALPSFSELSASAAVTPIPDKSQGLDMLYSSGTTGRPKGVKWALPDQPVGSPSMLIELLSGLFGYRLAQIAR